MVDLTSLVLQEIICFEVILGLYSREMMVFYTSCNFVSVSSLLIE